MYILRRWWDKHGVAVVLGGLTLSLAWFVRQTQGAALFEAYQLLTRPLQSEPTQEERLTNAKVLELQQRQIELESQNQKLKELLNYSKTKDQQGILAPIIGRSAGHWWQHVTLGRGSRDGIKVHSIVMAPGGLVGQIVNVTPNTSRVLLISDATSRVGAVISRSRSMGFIRGQGSNRAVLQFFDKVPDVRRGDAVSTSPVSKLFPAGLPLGRVESVNLDKSPAPEAVIELTAPLDALEWVIVYPQSRTVDPE
ncbi:rod shape-determining protein MreC [Coleofasciculus chthonoplastes PCC 7420]|uniref:Cell shape-determining protein MreC n=1 Tax=Coleofasciculus chthonoplastes PCC 7420 TaxID=118168 RepID=B4VW76_9CYAN|nr:rod shape-determining protein MreC [Coleofasciculus chthonoplastes]EDX73998.1 rod shape-determining protein MreC [Coleofasciculus chthonoplastes PCC 7420]